MLSLKRTHPDDDSAMPVPRVLASRMMFFSIPLSSVAVRGGPATGLVLANTRVTNSDTVLNGLQRASLTAVLAVLNDYFPDDETIGVFTHSIGDITTTDDTALASFADKIDLGLTAFLAKRGSQPNTCDPGTSSTVPDSTIPSTSKAASSTTAVPPKRARVSKKSSPSNRRSVDFWAFIAMFRGVEATAELKNAAFEPEPNNPDNIMNVIFLCYQCHVLLDKTMVSLIPQILESPESVFPYDPRMVDHYDAIVEFPAGIQRAVIAILQDDGGFKRMLPGHVLTLRTADPIGLPLPHPLLLQLHAICGRMVVMRAAGGYPVLADDDSDGDTVYDALRLGEEVIGEVNECFGEFGGKDVSRDPAVVVLELGQRKYEQEQLLQKLRVRENGGHGGLSA